MVFRNLTPYSLTLPPSRPRDPAVELPRPRHGQGYPLTTPALVRRHERAGSVGGVAAWSVREEITPGLPPPERDTILLCVPEVAKEAALRGRADCCYPVLARYGTRCDGLAFYSPRTSTWVCVPLEEEGER